MKKVFVILLAGCVAIGCGGNDTEKKDVPAKDTVAAEKPADDPDIAKGLTLVASNDCLTCHKINEPLTGPAYQQVAQRYEATPDVIDTLSQKIINGGAGKWGQIPMSPHGALSKEDAKAMVKYILSLRN